MNSTRPAGQLAPLLPKDQQRFALFLGGVGLALVLLIAARRPPALPLGGAITQIRQAARAWHRDRSVHALAAACRHEDCDCALASAKVGLDVDAGAQVLALLDATKACAKSSAFDGLRAEALVRAGSWPAGMLQADKVLVAASRDPYALQAQALGRYRQGDSGSALDLSVRAEAAGRGDGALLLEGLIHYLAGRSKEARRAFEAILATEPNDVAALYNLGLVARMEDRYGEARRLFLKVISESPEHKEARYHLALLAHSIGAEAEAQHHLAKLTASAPGDPLVSELTQALAQAPAHPPTHVLSLGSPASATSAAP